MTVNGTTDPDAISPHFIGLLQSTLGHDFEHTDLLRQALTHPSFINEHPAETIGHNQRLEFLGDAVLDFVVAEWIYEQYPHFDEGAMTRLRAAIVRTETLARLANESGIGPALRLGRGEEASGGRVRAANLCDAFESVVGALYLDAGFAVVKRFLEPLVAEVADETLADEGDVDAKSRLQERCQAEMGITPRYRIVAEHGPDHQKMFVAEAVVGDAVLGRGEGLSKQAAEQAAAQSASESLANEVHAP